MSPRVGMHAFDNDSVLGWDQSLGYNSKSFTRDGYYFEINVFLTAIQFTPVFVVLPHSGG